MALIFIVLLTSEHLTQDMFHLEIGMFKLKNSGVYVKKDMKFFSKVYSGDQKRKKRRKRKRLPAGALT